ncbi:MAG: GNAT family N-acetyltransferase [Phycisphaerales bacterium]
MSTDSISYSLARGRRHSPGAATPPPIVRKKPLPVLETDRLRLRAFTLDDAGAVQRLAGDRDIAKTTGLIPHPYPDGAAEEWIGGHADEWARNQSAVFAITHGESGELIGSIGVIIDADANQAELGYWIGKPYWGAGYATEAARELVRFSFEEIEVRRLHAHHMGSNPASGRVLEKVGMTREGTLRGQIKKWDRYEDAVWYGMLREEWSGAAESTTSR